MAINGLDYLWKDRKRYLGMPLSFTRYSLSEDRLFLSVGFLNIKDDEVLLLFGTEKTDRPLPTNVNLYGYTRDKHELAALYTMADVFVNCTREDSLSLINVEAQACGTPVVTFDATGPKETVDGKGGIYVTCGNYEQLYDSVSIVRNNRLKPNIGSLFFVFNIKVNYLDYILMFKK